MCLCMLLQVGWYQTNNSLSSKDKPPKSKSKIEQKRQKLKTAHCKKTFAYTYTYIQMRRKKMWPIKTEIADIPYIN